MTQQNLPKLRRLSQLLFLCLFLFHLHETEFRGSLKAASGNIRLPLPYPSIFLQSDPLVAVLNVLSSHALYRGLLWSLTILIPTLFLGRFFCGWICPLGTLNHFFSNWKSERKRGRERLERNRYKKMANVEVFPSDRRGDFGPARKRLGGDSGPHIVDGSLAERLAASRHELRA